MKVSKDIVNGLDCVIEMAREMLEIKSEAKSIYWDDMEQADMELENDRKTLELVKNWFETVESIH